MSTPAPQEGDTYETYFELMIGGRTQEAEAMLRRLSVGGDIALLDSSINAIDLKLQLKGLREQQGLPEILENIRLIAKGFKDELKNIQNRS